MSDLKAMLFVDGSNLFMAAERHSQGARIDLVSLAQATSKGMRLVRSHYYGSVDSTDPRGIAQRQFHEALARNGYTVNVTPLRIHDGRKVEKGADVSLAVDLVAHAIKRNTDIAILVSGDEDFVHALEHVKLEGVGVIVAFFSSQVGRGLRLVADSFVDLEPLFPKILRQHRGKT